MAQSKAKKEPKPKKADEVQILPRACVLTGVGSIATERGSEEVLLSWGSTLGEAVEEARSDARVRGVTLGDEDFLVVYIDARKMKSSTQVTLENPSSEVLDNAPEGE